VADAVGAKFTIREARLGVIWEASDLESKLDRLFAHVDQQEETLDSLQLRGISFRKHEEMEFFFSLARHSKKWSIDICDCGNFSPMDWGTLATKVSTFTNGSIDTVHVDTGTAHQGVKQADVKAVWRVCKNICVFHPDEIVEIGGGRGEGDTEAQWQRLLECLFEV